MKVTLVFILTVPKYTRRARSAPGIRPWYARRIEQVSKAERFWLDSNKERRAEIARLFCGYSAAFAFPSASAAPEDDSGDADSEGSGDSDVSDSSG